MLQLEARHGHVARPTKRGPLSRTAPSSLGAGRVICIRLWLRDPSMEDMSCDAYRGRMFVHCVHPWFDILLFPVILCSRGTPRKVDTYVWKHSCTGSPCRVLDATAKEKLPATRSSSPWIRRGSIPVTWLKSGLPCPFSMPACCGLSWCLVATSYHNHEMSARAENGKRFKKPTGKWMQFPWNLTVPSKGSQCVCLGRALWSPSSCPELIF